MSEAHQFSAAALAFACAWFHSRPVVGKPKKYRPPQSDYQKDLRILRILGVVAVVVVSAVLIFLVSGPRLPWR